MELFNQDEADFSFTMALRNNHIVNTSTLYFESDSIVSVDANGKQSITFQLKSESGAGFDFIYTLPANDYMLDFVVKSNDMQTIMSLGSNYMIINWDAKIRQQEKGRQFEERYSTLNYKFVSDDMEKLSESKDDKKNISTNLNGLHIKINTSVRFLLQVKILAIAH